MFIVVAVRDGRSALEFTPQSDSVRFSLAAVGGFGSCSFRLPGIEPLRELPLLSTIRLYFGTFLLWEGRVEDVRLTISSDSALCDVTCFGFRRLLEETSIKRAWLLRSINWQPSISATGLAVCSALTPTLSNGTTSCVVGQFDPSDLSRVGIKVDDIAASTAPESNWAIFNAPSGITLVRVRATVATPAGGATGIIQDSITGSGWTSLYCSTADGAVNVACSANAGKLLMGGMTTAAPGAPDTTWEDIRILCTSIDEDETGGIYGSSILRDLVPLVTGIVLGTVETSSEFAIPAIARTARDSALSVIEEVAAYYSREWGVWEDARFDWKTPNLDEVHWVSTLDELSKLEVESSVDGATKTVYLLYEDAASGVPGEQSAISTDRRNPYVKSGRVKDEVLQAPVVMTSTSASRLATKLAGDRGATPAVRGRVELPATALVQHVALGARPAFTIRAGENLVIPDLPKDDYFRPGRDGQTLFHIRSVETDMEQAKTTLELEGYSRRSDILLARIGAVTRAILG